jgi:hypothetical protein
VPRLKPVGKTQRPPQGVGYTSKIKRGFHRNLRTTDMGVGSSALCDVREARTRTGKVIGSQL